MIIFRFLRLIHIATLTDKTVHGDFVEGRIQFQQRSLYWRLHSTRQANVIRDCRSQQFALHNTLQ